MCVPYMQIEVFKRVDLLMTFFFTGESPMSAKAFMVAADQILFV